MRLEIFSTRHWQGDARLNRHIEYVNRAGHSAKLTTFGTGNRAMALIRALAAVARSDAKVVLFPDPDLFFPGAVAARLTGKRPVIDIHEEYAKTAMTRTWIPDWARPLARLAAAALVALGRLTAWKTVVAAPELARKGDLLAMNIPDPESFDITPLEDPHRLVYVGDITVARGAITMLDALALLDDSYELVLVGRASQEVRAEVAAIAAKHDMANRVHLTGQLSHSEAWRMARGSLAGLSLLEPAPAYREAVATKLWEYMASGLPAIVSDLPGQARLLRQVEPTLVCHSARDVAAVARKLGGDHQLRAAIVDRGRRLVEESWAKNRPDRVIQSILEP
jgi:glycosyltransferase involved in cell wall biosynthesis